MPDAATLALITGPYGALVVLVLVVWFQRGDIKDLRTALAAKEDVVLGLLRDSIKSDADNASASRELASATRAATAAFTVRPAA